MHRPDFHRLAETRLGDAQALLIARCYSAAYYLAGYAVECALKACIANQTRRHDFPPDPRSISRIYTHQLDTLVQVADLRSELDTETSIDPQFKSIGRCWPTGRSKLDTRFVPVLTQLNWLPQFRITIMEYFNG